MKGCILFLTALFVALAQGEKLSVQVYYEALCPDSLNFLNKQFFKTWLELKNEFDVELVPFGFAVVTHKNGTYQFKCQHGANECYANKYHACALHLYPGEESIRFIDCGMETGHPDNDGILKWCAKRFNLSLDNLKNCYSNGQGDKWLEAYGKETNAVTPEISFIPTVTFNHKFDQSLQDQSMSDFKKVVCTFLENEPEVCKH